jgi:hypothetical protein
MILKRFRRRLRNYGYKRLLISPDFLAACILTLGLFTIEEISTGTSEIPTVEFVNFEFVAGLVPVLASLTSFIITGLAVLVSLTNKDFLAELSDLGVYPNILFMFEFNIVLLGWTAILAVIITTYEVPNLLFYLFLFFFLYSVFSLTELMQLISNTGINKARYERQKSENG